MKIKSEEFAMNRYRSQREKNRNEKTQMFKMKVSSPISLDFSIEFHTTAKENDEPEFYLDDPKDETDTDSHIQPFNLNKEDLL